eukprot:gnl/TRDRNA2_/TRDRNA2_152586_c0_seq1.p1 gnl/TRDRNA2_/TRDRNA2_152586_c0~~gnl/TRDRNA2_/TRDRNA2_152586_c0_seq1.p1  ORF type:complete len:474 (-),score=71.29 gnl/TRDRNA2_/TRDRNA2_152586_c0_seq1:133-1395(-)
MGGSPRPSSLASVPSTPEEAVPEAPAAAAAQGPTRNRGAKGPPDWEELWGRLTAEGWSIENGPRGDPYYMPPGIRRGPGAKVRVDYFDSRMQVMRHLKLLPPEEKNSKRKGSDSTSASRPSVVTPTAKVLKRPRLLSPSTPAPVNRASAATATAVSVEGCGRGRGRGRGLVAAGRGRQPLSVRLRAVSRGGAAAPRQGRPLQGWIVALTGFSARETNELHRLAEQCGATLSKVMPPRQMPGPGGGLAVVATGELTTVKFLAALALGVPPVTKRWLEVSASDGAPANAEPYALALKEAISSGRGWDRAFQPQPHVRGVLARRGHGHPAVVRIVGSRVFSGTWAAVLRAAGARVAASVCMACDYIFAEGLPLRLSGADARAFQSSGARAVGLDWLKTCLSAQCEDDAGAGFGPGPPVEVVVH